MKAHLLALVALLILLTGESCKKEGSDSPATPFTITNLHYSPTTATIQAHLPLLLINGTAEYSHAQKGVAQLRLQTSGGADLSVPVQGATQADGVITGTFDLAMPTKAGSYTFQLWMVDGNGTSSNKLSGTVTMSVNDEAKVWNMVSQQYELHKVIWGANKYLAVGSGGTIVSSPNGGSWTVHNSGTTNTLQGACWTGQQYVAVGDNRTILTSTDGTTWSRGTVPGSIVHLYGVASSGSNIIVVGENIDNNSSAILSSPDGITWTLNEATVTGGRLRGITWAGNRYVAVGEAFGYPLVLISANGTTWTNRTGSSDFPGQLSEVAWSGSKYVATGYGVMATSADGATWSYYNNPQFSAAGITWSGSRFVAAGITGIYTSADGLSWSKAFDSVYPFYGITWSGFQYVAVGFVSPIIMVSP